MSDGINHGQKIDYCPRCHYPLGVCGCKMDLPTEVVLRVLHKGLPPEGTARLLQDYSDIRAKVLDKDKKIARIRKTAAEEIKKLEAETFCNHDFTKYHGDPSGGSDSHEQCLICGENIYDKKYRRS